jgi:hypothetical protein
MTRSDRIALLLSLLAVLASYLVSEAVFEQMAHIEDEMAYVWQAQAISRGQISVPSPLKPKSFLWPFVVDYNGKRFSKYPLGWPVMLAIGIRLGIRSLVNPLLAGLGVWLTYRLGQRTLDDPAEREHPVGLLAAGLTLTSPFFLINSGLLLSHPFGLALSAAFALAWLDAFCEPVHPHPWLPTLVAALCLGVLALTRPMTAIAVGLPFGFHGLYLLIRSGRTTRLRLLILGLIVLALSSLLFVWQYAVTGDPFMNPYTLWWPYDKVGFGPGYGVTEYGHNIFQALFNTKASLRVGYHDLFGWGAFSWIFIPFGLFAALRNRRALLVSSVFFSLVIVYLAYWIGSYLFGPRYFYEGLYSLTLLSAAGIAWLAGWPVRSIAPAVSEGGCVEQTKTPLPGHCERSLRCNLLLRDSHSAFGFWRSPRWRRVRALGMTALLALLVSANLLFYTPMRLSMLFGLYGVQRSHIEPFLTPSAQELTPALIVVHTSGKWIQYGTLIELENPFLDSPFIFIIARGPDVDQAVIAQFPDRRVFHYYPETPYTFYLAP